MRIRIDRLNLKLGRMPKDQARATVDGVGRQIGAELLDRGITAKGAGSRRIGAIDGVTVKASREPGALPAGIARAVADAIESRLNRGGRP